MNKRRPRRYKISDIIPNYTPNEFSPYQYDVLVAHYEDIIDERLQDLYEHLGREITKEERKILLTIVGEYSPKDKDGEIIADCLLPFEYAWTIYEATKDQRLDDFLGKLKIK